MSAETTKKTSKAKLPAEIFFREGEEIKKTSLESVIEVMVSEEEGDGNVVASGDDDAETVAKKILLLNMQSYPEQAEIPESYSDESDELETGNDYAFDVVKEHFECKKILEEKEANKKAQATAEKEAAKKAKEKEEEESKKIASKFGDRLAKSVAKYGKSPNKMLESVVTNLKLPSTVQLASGGMGLKIADGASADDIAEAVGATVSIMEGVKNTDTALQFIIGDLVNASVSSGTFKKKGKAAEAIKVALQEKCNKNMDIITIQAYATMAERVTVEKRKPGVKPTLYLAASKLTLPKSKDARGEDVAALEQKLSDFREEIIEKINDDKYNTTTLNEAIKEFKVKNNLIKPEDDASPAVIAELSKKLFYSMFLESIANKKGDVSVTRGKERHKYSGEEVAAIKKNAFDGLVSLLITNKGLEVDSLIAGTVEVEVKGKMEDVPYRMPDPFWTPPTKAEREAAKAKAEAEKAAAEAKANKAKAKDADADDDDGDDADADVDNF